MWQVPLTKAVACATAMGGGLADIASWLTVNMAPGEMGNNVYLTRIIACHKYYLHRCTYIFTSSLLNWKYFIWWIIFIKVNVKVFKITISNKIVLMVCFVVNAAAYQTTGGVTAVSSLPVWMAETHRISDVRASLTTTDIGASLDRYHQYIALENLLIFVNTFANYVRHFS